MAGRVKLALFLVAAIGCLALTNIGIQAVRTLNRLDFVEAERDTWERPAEVIRALDLTDGDTVIDLGSGAGYFALRLSPVVGRRGSVLAVDLRKLSLAFLWVRSVLKNKRNIRVRRVGPR